MKKFKLLLPVLLTLVSCNSFVYASEIPQNINKEQPISVVTYENESFFPVRLLNDTLGYKLSWDSSTKSTLLENETLTVSLGVNKQEVLVNQLPVTLTKAPKLIDNVLYAPAEFWAKAFNLNVSLENEQVIFTPIEEPIAPPNEIPLIDIEVIEHPIQQTILPLFEGSNTYCVQQDLIIRLDENPSTGYIWQVDFPEGIELISDHFVPNKPTLAGSPGEHTWIIKAITDGTYTIEFNKLRPSEPNTVIDTKTFKLKTKPVVVPQN